MVISPKQLQRRYARIGGRVVIAALAVGLFVAVASMFEPGDTSAMPQRINQPANPMTLSQGTFLGEIVGRGHSVLIHASPDGPRYTALDSLGNIIASDLRADEVYRLLPDVNIETLSADENGLLDSPLILDDALMLVDHE